MTRLTDKFIGDIRSPAKGQVIYRDDDLTGFGLRVTKGSMSWIVESKTGGKTRRITICRASELSAEQARKEARRILAEFVASADDHAPTFKAPTLAEVLAA